MMYGYENTAGNPGTDLKGGWGLEASEKHGNRRSEVQYIWRGESKM